MSLVLTGARIFNGVEAALVERRSVFIVGDRVSEISDRPPNPGDGRIVDCSGHVVMPGLIDAHVHACAFSANPHEGDGAPSSMVAAWATLMLGRMLDRGFTTVRDCGGADYGLAAAIKRRYFRSPRLYFCGRALCQTGGAFDMRDPLNRIDATHPAYGCACGYFNDFASVVDGVDNVRAAAREGLRRGASFIKLMVSGDVTTTGSRLQSLEYSDAEIRAIVDEAERAGVYCAAHAHPDRAIRRAIELGVHCIEHGSLIEPETARLAAEKGVFVIPTLAVLHAMSRRGADAHLHPVSAAKLASVAGKVMDHLVHLRDAGVRIGFGTDLLGVLESDQCTEFTLRRAVFQPVEILMQATSVNAEAIGARGEIGVVAVGALADLLVVDGNPLDDIALLARDGAALAMILQGGEVIKDAFAGSIARAA